MLRKLYGDDFWKEFAKQRPRGFDSRAQLFDRLAKGDDKVCALAEYAGYVLYKEKGAAIEFVAPAGRPAGDAAPHRRRRQGAASGGAKLFVDWAMSNRGQTFYQSNPHLIYGSLRNDAPPMPTGKRLADFKLLFPTDWADYLGQPRQVHQGMERHARAVGSAKHAGARAAVAGPVGPGHRRLRRRRRRGASSSSTRSSILLQAALDVGDPEARPPTAYGLDNFAGLPQLLRDHAQHAHRRRLRRR